MAVVMVSWIYMILVCTLIGIGVLHLLTRRSETAGQVICYYLMAGIIAITVYAEVFSLAGKVGILSHMLMLLVAVTVGVVERRTVVSLWKKYKIIIFSWEGFFYICFLLMVAFFTSRGSFHVDTNIYHAQMIRLYEEYGLIKGMGNLQLHFAYNSAYLAFAAIFSFRWLGGQSLHTTTGFIAAIMCLYAFHGLKEFKQHERHVADMMRIGILFYTLVMLCGSMSPATDYAAMFFSLYVITAWCENLESGKSLDTYSLLSVAAVFVATLKFSACFLALIVVYPAVFLVKGKRWKEIARYIASGFVIVVPFLVRNYLISGWLLYPFNGIDIFHVRWKIPEEYLLVDAEQIKVWGRGLYDIGKIDWPVRRWLPIWWEELERYEKMLLGAFLAGTVLLMVLYAKRIFRRGKIEWDLAAALLAVYSSMALWFVMAPFIRYGLAFIFTVPMVALGEYLGEKKKGLYSIVAGSLVFCIIVSISLYWDHYITDAGVFIKQNLKKPYYLMQKDYDDGEEAACEINGNVIYYSVGGEVNTYHVCPSTCYEFMLERSTLMGEELKDGFMAK